MHTRYCLLSLIVAVGPALTGAIEAAQAANAASSAAPAATVTISGKAVDSRGGPVEGAKVTVYQTIYSDTGSMPTTEALGDKNTGADGTFTLTVTPQADPYQYGYVVARKPGLALGWAMWRGQVREPVEILLGEPKDLAGEVVDEQGRPLAEADVSIAMAMMGRPEDRRYLSSPGFLTAKTDANGRFVCAALPAEATFELLAQKAGRATVDTFDRTAYRGTRSYQFSPGQTGIRLTLPPEARIEGVAVTKAGEPIAGVKLTAQSDPLQGAVLYSKPAATAQDGVFRIGGLAPGMYVVRLPSARRGQMLEWVAEPARVSLKAGETRGDVKLQLVKGGIVEVLVKDDAGKPIANASVSLRHTQLEEWMGGTTDPNGLARMRVLPGRYNFSGAYKEGYGRQMGREEVAVEEGETKRIESILNTLPKIAGVVRDEAGNPLAGVKVEVKPSGREEITTDAAGKFEASWDPTSWSSGRTTFVVVARDAARNLAEAADIDEQAGNIDVKLRPAVSITGIVLDEAGKPLPGARLRVMLRVSNWGATLGRTQPVAGPDGRFEIKALPPERKYTVTAMADGYGKQDVTVDASDFKDNRHDTGELKLPLANLSITGVVVDVNDKPVAGAGIYGYSQGHQPDIREIFTDAEGRFTVKGVCAGLIRLQVNSRGPTPMYGSVQAEGGATDLRIVISQRPTGQPYMPRRPASLKGKPLPPLKDVGIDLPADAAGKMLLVCFWDMGQRPSRYCLTQLAARAAQLRDQGVEIVTVHAAQVEGGALIQWLETNKVPFKAGTIAGDIEKAKFAWGVTSMPYLILTDKKRTVVAEGFGLNELDKQLEANAGW
jgi:protocatechuate 3,4-dioxygenase beta subunit